MTTYFDQVATSIKYLSNSLSYLLDASLQHLPPASGLKSITMLTDALSWIMLVPIRFELLFNGYKLGETYMNSGFKSPRGQYRLASFVITLLAQFTVQYQLNWLMTIYILYLLTGLGVWLHRRVYFYHRKLDSLGVNQTINHFDSNKHLAAVASAALNNGLSNGGGLTDSNYATLKKSSSNHHNNGGGGGVPSSAASSTSSNGGGALSGDHTNSLQRQRALAYRDFRSLLTEPRHNTKEFALSLAHLSNISELVGSKDVFDEMHFQILATRRDVVNILSRLVLIAASCLLVYMH